MGVLRFDGADWIRFSTLATALGNTSDGAWTVAVLLRQATDSGFQGYTYLCGAGPDTKAGIGRQSGGLLLCDIDSYASTGQDVVGTTETYIAVAAKAAGTNPVTYHLFTKSAGTWATPIVGGNLTDTAASTMLEIGTWQGGSDMADAWIGLVAFWEGAMSTGNVTQLDDSWQTSDWYASPHGVPTALIECNVNAASLVDFIGNATNLSVTGTPTLDGAETLVGWNFNGDGTGEPDPGVPAAMPDFSRSLFPFIAKSSYRMRAGRVDSAGISAQTRERGPAPYGGFQRYLFQRLHPVFEAGGVVYDEFGSLTAGGLASGVDTHEHIEAGSLIAGVLAAGSDVFTAAEAGALIAAVLASGADTFTAVEAGSLVAGALTSGVSATPISQKAGSIIASVLAAGADVFTAAEAGALLASALTSGADSVTRTEAGSLTAGTVLAGTDAFTAAETGSVTTAAFAAGADVAEHPETGSITTFGLAAGADVFEHAESGTIMAFGLLSGVATTVTGAISQKAGSVTAGSLTAGADSAQRAETGSLVASALLAGLDAHTATKIGSLIAGTVTAGADSTTRARTGTIAAQVVLSGVGTTVLPAPWIEAGFTATSTLEGVATGSSMTGGFSATGTLEGEPGETGIEAGFATVGGLEA